MQKASQAASREIDQRIQTAQREATPDKSATEILMQQSQDDVATELKGLATDKEKRVAASNMFFGAYFLNIRTRSEYCRTLGVSIPTFVTAYKRKHRDLFAAAERYQIEDFREHGYRYDIDKLYKMMQPSMDKVIALDMEDIASTLHVSEREACSLFEQNADAVVDEMDLRKRMPEVAQILLAGH